MSLVLAVKVARVSPLFNELQLVRRLLTIWMSQIVMSNADKMDAGKKSNNLPMTGGTCNQNRVFINTLRATCYQNRDFLCMFKLSFTRISSFLCMTHATGAQR